MRCYRGVWWRPGLALFLGVVVEERATRSYQTVGRQKHMSATGSYQITDPYLFAMMSEDGGMDKVP